MSTRVDDLLVVVFDGEPEADKGLDALRELHAQGRITLHRLAVVAKHNDGKPVVKEGSREVTDQTAIGSAVELVAGNLGGVPSAPAGIRVVAGYLEEVKSQLEPGKVAVIAEVEEELSTPVDVRMASLGGKVYRRQLGEMLHERIEQDLDEIRAQRDTLDAQHVKATEGANERLQARVEAARTELRQIQDRARAQLEDTQRELDAKVAELNAQAADARAERKQELAKRLAEVQAEQKARMDKLRQALELAREALEPTKPDWEQLDASAFEGRPLIERVYEGMTVVDSDGKKIGRVQLVRMGEPEALTNKGQYRDERAFAEFLAIESEPDVPVALRASLIRAGYLKVERNGPFGIGEKNHYVRADEIADVSGGRVLLTVPQAKLADKEVH